MLAYHLSSERFIKPFQQLYCCTLTTARLANQCHGLTLIDAEVQALENVDATACGIREVNVCEVNSARARHLSKTRHLLTAVFPPIGIFLQLRTTCNSA